MKNFDGKIVWITGASSGIGREMSRQLSEKGAKIILSARRENELENLRSQLLNSENHLVLPLDMERQNEFPAKVKTVIKKYGKVDLLFLNAGISQRSDAAETDVEVDRKLMEVNYFGQVFLTKKILPFLKKQTESHIAVTSSLAGKFGFYKRSAYAASKHALHGFFETLRLEEQDVNMKVTMLCPGGVQTDISKNALQGDGSAFGQESNLQKSGIPVGKCVAEMIDAIQKEKYEVLIGGFMEKISVKVQALLPSVFYKKLEQRKP